MYCLGCRTKGTSTELDNICVDTKHLMVYSCRSTALSKAAEAQKSPRDALASHFLEATRALFLSAQIACS